MTQAGEVVWPQSGQKDEVQSKDWWGIVTTCTKTASFQPLGVVLFPETDPVLVRGLPAWSLVMFLITVRLPGLMT